MYLKYKRETRNCSLARIFGMLLLCFPLALLILVAWTRLGTDYPIFKRATQTEGLMRNQEKELDILSSVDARFKDESELISALMNLTRRGARPISAAVPSGSSRLYLHRPTPASRSKQRWHSRKPRVTPRIYRDVIIVTPKPSKAVGDEGKPRLSTKKDGAVGHELLNAFFEQVVPDHMTGKLNAHIWDRICGPHVEQLRQSPLFPRFPSYRRQANELRSQHEGTGFGERIFGFIYPPTSGSYQFATTSDDTSELWLSTDSDPKNSRLIATVFSTKGIGFTKAGDFQKYPTQISRNIELKERRKYYIEVLHKQGRGKSHLEVLWKTPGKNYYERISSAMFSMYTDETELTASDKSDGESRKEEDFERYAPKDNPSHMKRKLDPELEKFLYKC